MIKDNNDIELQSYFTFGLSRISASEISNNYEKADSISVFAFCIKKIRKKYNLTQKELAARTNISENTIYNYENGRSKPTKANKSKILLELNISESTIDDIEGRLISYKRAKDFDKKRIERENKRIVDIAKEIKSIDHVILYRIVDFIIDKNLLDLDDLTKAIEGFKMLKANNNFLITGSCPLGDEYKKIDSIELTKKSTNEQVSFRIENFINEILIYLSEEVDKIFNIKAKISSRYIYINEYSDTQREQYKKLDKLLKGEVNE